MQFLYTTDHSDPNYTRGAVLKLGRTLLEIRKSIGNKETKLKEADMLRSLLKDIDKLNL